MAQCQQTRTLYQIRLRYVRTQLHDYCTATLAETFLF